MPASGGARAGIPTSIPLCYACSKGLAPARRAPTAPSAIAEATADAGADAVALARACGTPILSRARPRSLGGQQRPKRVQLSDLTDTAAVALREAGGRLSDLMTPTVRLGVTGLARAGKTVFITALVRSLVEGGRLPFFHAMA